MPSWFSRPVIFVADIERAIAFYVERLGFRETNRYAEGERVLVGEVSREDCTLLLDCQQPERTGRGRMFISVEQPALDTLRAEFAGRGAAIRDGWWGYPTMIVTDPDGNELYFPYPGPRRDDAEAR